VQYKDYNHDNNRVKIEVPHSLIKEMQMNMKSIWRREQDMFTILERNEHEELEIDP
jgi:hypothetical protein